MYESSQSLEYFKYFLMKMGWKMRNQVGSTNPCGKLGRG